MTRMSPAGEIIRESNLGSYLYNYIVRVENDLQSKKKKHRC